MAKIVVLEASVRERGGKGAARAIRREGRVPAVIYGDKKDPILVSFGYQDLAKHVNTGRFMSMLVEVAVDGDNVRSIARDVQFDPVRDTIQHIDFLRLGKGARIVVEVPCNFLNEDECPGLTQGGTLNVVRYEIEMDVRATQIPESIDVDLAGLNIGDGVHGSDLTLPEGATLAIDDRDFTVCTIAAPSGGADEDEDEAAAAEGEEAEAGEGEEADAAEGES